MPVHHRRSLLLRSSHSRSIPRRRPVAALLAAFVLVLGMLAAVGAVGTGEAAAQAAVGTVRGSIGGKHGTPKVTVLYFTQTWGYLGSVKAYGGGYSLSLQPGTYYLQFVDKAPSYDVKKYAPTDVAVTVTSATTTVRNVKMRPGAALGGTVRAGGQPGAKARVVAANTLEQSFETTADAEGRWALGGLPPGKYSVFTYDRRKKQVGQSVYAGKLKKGSFRAVKINLDKRAGSLLVDLYAGNALVTGNPYVTAVSLKTGQFWTAKAKLGSATFRGLYPGRYQLVAPAYGGFLAETARIQQGRVRSGKAAFGSFRWTQPGASVAGTVVSGRDGTPLGGAQVLLFDAAGGQVASTVAAGDGRFVLSGPLATQAGASVVAQPGQTAPYLGQGPSYCKYAATTVGAVVLTAARTTDVGAVALPLLPDAQQDSNQCRAVPQP